MDIYRVYDGTGYMVTSVEAFDTEGAEKAAADMGYGEGHRVEVAWIKLGDRLVSWEYYMSM